MKSLASPAARAAAAPITHTGYILATGERPYVLVDRFGNMNALPKLIEDRGVRVKNVRHIKLDRAAHRPTGLAAFIGRISGVELMTKKIYQYRDASRYKLFLAEKMELAGRQQRGAVALDRRH